MELILIVDCGVSRGQSLAKQIRARGVYSEIVPGFTSWEKIKELNPKGIITLGAPGNELEKQLRADCIPVWELGDFAPRQDELERFLNKCQCSRDWNLDMFIDQSVEEIKTQVGTSQVICGLSGGIDSSVAALLAHKAVKDQLICIYVDNGLMREGESKQVMSTFQGRFQIPLVHVDARERFLSQLAGVEDPEEKRKIIGTEFIRVFREEAAKIGAAPFLVQGTLYSDVVESGAEKGAFVKSHHNVGGLPSNLPFELVEPLKRLFKDEVRVVAEKLSLPEEIVWRHPFPGPGLAIRIMGAVTSQKLTIVRQADAIAMEEIRQAGLYKKIWQALVVLTNMRTVGVFQGERTYDYVVALRFVDSEDGMSADWSKVPFEVLEKISHRLLQEVPGISRVVYDISPKPPATIEWE